MTKGINSNTDYFLCHLKPLGFSNKIFANVELLSVLYSGLNRVMYIYLYHKLTYTFIRWVFLVDLLSTVTSTFTYSFSSLIADNIHFDQL